MTLSKDKQQQSKSSKKRKKREQEHLSTKDWEDIMGVRKDVYTRHNGAVRRK